MDLLYKVFRYVDVGRMVFEGSESAENISWILENAE
jgi:hypothetical protein